MLNNIHCLLKAFLALNLVFGMSVNGARHAKLNAKTKSDTSRSLPAKVMGSDDEVLQPLFEKADDEIVQKDLFSLSHPFKKSVKSKKPEIEEFDDLSLMTMDLDLPSIRSSSTRDSSTNSNTKEFFGTRKHFKATKNQKKKDVKVPQSSKESKGISELKESKTKQVLEVNESIDKILKQTTTAEDEVNESKKFITQTLTNSKKNEEIKPKKHLSEVKIEDVSKDVKGEKIKGTVAAPATKINPIKETKIAVEDVKIIKDIAKISVEDVKLIKDIAKINLEEVSKDVKSPVIEKRFMNFDSPFEGEGLDDDVEIIIFQKNITSSVKPGSVINEKSASIGIAPGNVIVTKAILPGTVIATKDVVPGTVIATKEVVSGNAIATKEVVPGTVIASIEEKPKVPIVIASINEKTDKQFIVSNISVPIWESFSIDENVPPPNIADNNKDEMFFNLPPKVKKIRTLDVYSIAGLSFDYLNVGPKISLETEITNEYIVNTLIPFFKSGKVLDRKSTYTILFRAYEKFLDEESLQDIELDSDQQILIFGDIHGQFYDFVKVIEKEGYPSDKLKYLFNGDIVDRGAYSIECLLTLLAFKIAQPKNFYVTLGNHETPTVGRLQFHKESVSKSFPTAYLIQKEVFVTHGGIAPFLDLDRIREVDRIEPDIDDEDIINDLIWSDPINTNGTTTSHRGLGFLFGPDITRDFVVENNISVIIRSHQYKEFGFSEQHDGLCITIFSCPNYRGKMKNYGAYIKLDNQLNLTYNTFKAAEHNGKFEYPSIPADLKFARNIRRIR